METPSSAPARVDKANILMPSRLLYIPTHHIRSDSSRMLDTWKFIIKHGRWRRNMMFWHCYHWSDASSNASISSHSLKKVLLESGDSAEQPRGLVVASISEQNLNLLQEYWLATSSKDSKERSAPTAVLSILGRNLYSNLGCPMSSSHLFDQPRKWILRVSFPLKTMKAWNLRIVWDAGSENLL